jgi:hypothetical protein
MDAVMTTAIGLLGAALLGSFGSFFYLGTRIDALGARLDSRMDAQGARIDGLSDRLDAQSARLDAQSARMDAQEATIQAQGRDLAAAIQAQAAELGSRRPHGHDGRTSWPSRGLTQGMIGKDSSSDRQAARAGHA